MPVIPHLSMIRLALAAMLSLCIIAPSLGQDEPLRFQIAIGQSKPEILKVCGKPFGLFNVETGDINSQIGAPPEVWTVFHLTPFEDRMYATIGHFSTSTNRLDALMLEPVGFWSVDQILRDHPLIASICAETCSVEQFTEKTANQSLLLKPSRSSAGQYAIYFIGDTGSRFKSITSMQSIVSWVFIVPVEAFESRHTGYQCSRIGEWKPGR